MKLGTPEITGQWGRGEQGPGRSVSSVSTLPWGSCSTGVIQARRLWCRWGEVSMVTTGREGSELAPSFTLVRLGGERWCWCWVLGLGPGSAGPPARPLSLHTSLVCCLPGLHGATSVLALLFHLLLPSMVPTDMTAQEAPEADCGGGKGSATNFTLLLPLLDPREAWVGPGQPRSSCFGHQRYQRQKSQGKKEKPNRFASKLPGPRATAPVQKITQHSTSPTKRRKVKFHVQSIVITTDHTRKIGV